MCIKQLYSFPVFQKRLACPRNILPYYCVFGLDIAI